jgi:peroxiredoxin
MNPCLRVLGVSAALLVWLGAGGAPAAANPTAEIRAGVYRAVLSLPGGDLPFLFQLARRDSTGPSDEPGNESGAYDAWLLNGTERVPVEEVRVVGNALSLNLLSFNSRIAAIGVDGSLKGTLQLIKRGGKPQVIPFTAEYGDTFRFFREPVEAKIDVAGRWSVTFIDENGIETPAVGEFRQDGSSLVGTFLTSTGDYRYLAGNVAADSMCLSCFDGGHAFLFRARLNEHDVLEGDYWSGMAWHERWIGVRDEAAALADPDSLTFLKSGYDRLTFSFPNVTGETVSLSDPKFQGKVVIVVLAGSWCPNCHDEAAFLSAYYDANRDKGLEIVSLMYEHFSDFETASLQVKRFRKRYDIHYDLLIAGTSDKAEASQTLPMLNRVLAFPTTIFVDRRGAVRKIYTGFSGPGTGEHYEAFETSFSEFVGKLLAE